MASAWYEDPSAVIQLLTMAMPLIEALVRMIEGIFGKDSGTVKKGVAMTYVGKVLPGLPGDLASSMIDAQVYLLNEGKVFKHGE